MTGLATTMTVLANTDNDAAATVLLGALESSQREIRDEALTALLSRHNDFAERRVLGRWNDLSARWKAQIAQRVGWLSGAIRRAVLDGDQRHCECACAAAVYTRDYDLIPAFVGAACDGANPYAELAAAAALELAELLSEELAAPRDYRVRRDPQMQRQHVLSSLERAAAQLEQHSRSELLEAFVLLANRENVVLKRLLQSRTDRSFSPLVELFGNSSRPASERLLLSYLDDPHAPLSAIQIIGRRSDVAFLRHAARKIGAEPSPTVRANLQRIESVPWINGNLGVLDALGEAEQPGVVHLTVTSSAPREQALEVLAYILRHGKVAGRRAAAKALAEFSGPKANELALRGLQDDDSQVRAAVARQLRQRGVPGAISHLLDLLDSPHQAEREAAQAGLEEFHYAHFAADFDNLTPEAQQAAGRLVRRIDPEAVVRVGMELDAPNRGRRKRALEMVVALDAVAELHDTIAALLSDDDQFLRIEAIRVLATIDSPTTRQVLRDALLDSHPLVQEAAESALAQLTHRDTVHVTGISRDTVRLTSNTLSDAQSSQPGSPATQTASEYTFPLSPLHT